MRLRFGIPGGSGAPRLRGSMKLWIAGRRSAFYKYDGTFNGNVAGAADNGSGLIRITTSAAHGLAPSDEVVIASVGGTTEANGTWTITAIAATTFDLQGSTFANAYTTGGTWNANGMLADADAAVVGRATDMSGTDNHAIQATAAVKPLNKVNIVKGQRVLRGDGSDDAMSLTAAITTGVSHSVFLVYSFASVAAGKKSVFVDGAGTWGIYRNADHINDWTSATSDNTAALSVATFYLTSIVVTANSGSYFLNGRALNTLFGDAAGFCAMDLAEIIFDDVALSTARRKRRERYLERVYGLTVV